MIEHINDLQLTSLQGSGLKTIFQNILDACIKKNSELRKLKLSKTNLNDDKIVEQLCQIIETNRNLTSLDISWGSLSSKHMFMIAKSLNEAENVIMNLNLGYNSLTFLEPANNQKEIFYNSEDCFEQLCEYLQATQYLVHLDLSGLSFQKE